MSARAESARAESARVESARAESARVEAAVRARGAGAGVRLACVGVVLACGAGAVGCGSDPAPPPRVAREGAGVQVQRVATRWTDTVDEEGFLENDPNGVVQFRVVTTRTLELAGDRAVTMRIEREETFETKAGTYRCKAKGQLAGLASYVWQAGEAEVRLSLAGGSLPRACDPPGFPVSTKVVGAAEMVLVLRSDRLIGRTSARDRTVMLPMP